MTDGGKNHPSSVIRHPSSVIRFLSFVKSDDVNLPAGLSAAPGFENTMLVKQGLNPPGECLGVLALEYFTDKSPSGQESVLCGGKRRPAKVNGSGRVNGLVAGC